MAVGLSLYAMGDAAVFFYSPSEAKAKGVPAGKLKLWAKQVGWEKLANSRGPTWRKIPEAERENLNEAKALALLEKNTSAIKRPVVEIGRGQVIVGFSTNEYEKIFK